MYRRLFTKRFLPEGTEEQLAWFDELCARTVRPRMAGRLLRSRGRADVLDLLDRVRMPTLVVHARGDRVSPIIVEIGHSAFLLSHVILSPRNPAYREPSGCR